MIHVRIIVTSWGGGGRGWILIGNGNGRVFWGAGNVLYFDLRNGYRGIHSSKDLEGCILKISALGSMSVRRPLQWEIRGRGLKHTCWC